MIHCAFPPCGEPIHRSRPRVKVYWQNEASPYHTRTLASFHQGCWDTIQNGLDHLKIGEQKFRVAK